MKKTLITALFAASAASSMALLPPLDIDFTSAAWSGANLQASATVGGVTASAWSIGGVPPSDNPLNGATAGLLSWESGDGLGVAPLGGADPMEEIDGVEALLIRFAGTAGDDINGIALTDIFANADGTGGDGNDEIGKATYSDLSTETFLATSVGAASNGELFIPLNPAKDLLWVEFYSGNNLSVKDDYSVAGFTKVPTNVPDAGSTLALMGLAMIGVGAVRRTVRR